MHGLVVVTLWIRWSVLSFDVVCVYVCVCVCVNQVLDRLRQVAAAKGMRPAYLLDTKGPEVHIDTHTHLQPHAVWRDRGTGRASRMPRVLSLVHARVLMLVCVCVCVCVCHRSVLPCSRITSPLT